MTYQQFFRQVCELTRGLGLIVRSESFVMPDCPNETACFISSDAHEVPVMFAGISSVPTVADATIQARVDTALELLGDLISGVAHLGHQQLAAYNRLRKQSEKMKPKLRLLDA